MKVDFTADLATSTLAALTVPNWTDDTGPAQNWTVGTEITAVQVPAATGNPAPSYAAVGSLPAGILFDTSTRVISGTPGAAGSGTITIRATNSQGSDDWTVTYTTAAATVPLALSDSDDTGLEVVAKALLVASAPGTIGNSPYADSDRGGTDSPLEGELGLGDDETVISRFFRGSSTELALNDNDSPAALDIGPYFDSGGAGEDLTLYFQTAADGEVSFLPQVSLQRAAATLSASPC